MENLLGLKKDDLIKTTKGNIGVVISTNKDNIKMLDISNVISIVNNLDYESKLNTRNLVAKNRFGDQIKNQTIVRIRQGVQEVFYGLCRGFGARSNISTGTTSSCSTRNLIGPMVWQSRSQITVQLWPRTWSTWDEGSQKQESSLDLPGLLPLTMRI